MLKQEKILEDIIYEAICYIEGDRDTEQADIHELYLILTKIDDIEDKQNDVATQRYEDWRNNK